jgi:transposase
MIVIGTDTHKRTHTTVAGSGELSGELTASALPRGFAETLDWAEHLGGERVWAIGDCRDVSRSLERFLIDRGERVVRVAPTLMGASRKATRSAGKSDSIDALAIARAALAEGPEHLPAATVDEQAQQIKRLLDHHDDLLAQRSDDQRRLRWHLHDLWPELELPARCLDRERWLRKVSRCLGRAEQSTRVIIGRELVAAIRARTSRVRDLELELGAVVKEKAPQLLALRGCGVLTAARIVGEIGDISRLFQTPSLPAWQASRRSRFRPADAIATAWTGAATASSTAPCIDGRSTRVTGALTSRTILRASKPRGEREWRTAQPQTLSLSMRLQLALWANPDPLSRPLTRRSS